MKTIHFLGVEYYVPDWAKFVTQDSDGIFVWENLPIINQSICFWPEDDEDKRLCITKKDLVIEELK